MAPSPVVIGEGGRRNCNIIGFHEWMISKCVMVLMVEQHFPLICQNLQMLNKAVQWAEDEEEHQKNIKCPLPSGGA